MASFRLGRFFSQPEILRGIDPENLLSLLADHTKALEVLGFALPEPDAAATIDYDALASMLMEPDKLPADLREAFYFIHEMATDEGMACLLDAAEEADIEIVGKPGPTPGDVAVQVWLKDRELLERKHAEQFLRNPRTFESFGTAVSPVPKYRDPTPRLVQMKKELDDFFEKKKRGRNTKMHRARAHVYPRNQEAQGRVPGGLSRRVRNRHSVARRSNRPPPGRGWLRA